METKTHSPAFTVSLRGYDREEVDEYLDSLAEALAQVEEAEERTRRMQAHVARCNTRIKELEDKIRTDTPRTGVALGARIGVLLTEAEEAAAETMAQAEADGARIVATANARVTEAEELMRSVTTRAEEQAIRIESVARTEAAEVVAEAEARATARTRQIEQWAEQVVSHTRAEEARMFHELQTAKETALAELQVLSDHRSAAARTLMDLREALGYAVGLAEPVADEPTRLANGSVFAGSESVFAGSESAVAGTEAAGGGSESLFAGTESAVIGTESAVIGTKSAVIGTKSAVAGTESAVAGTESAVAGTESEGAIAEFIGARTEAAVAATEPATEHGEEDAAEDTAVSPAAGDDLYLTGFTTPGDEQFETKLDAWVNGGDNSGL